ncbi:putative eka-like protein [Erysiphe necator]|uniref:Putative eka-like protein n=1 Tax=Uncinula necator TaxID=52586 RepID=A0A0B1NW67_UNCNE|nr:putative eka-like protein [Erysiphe necator]
MVCTSFISNIDSSVSSFKDGDELEMAKSIQAYLRNAISKFAASDTTPQLPEKQLKSNTTKVSENSKAHLPNKPLVTPFPSKISSGQVENMTNSTKDSRSQNPSGLENSWSTIARNGHKKSRTIITSRSQASQASKNPAQTTLVDNNIATAKNKDAAGNQQDNRLFLRLSVDHEWRKLSPAGVREIVVKRLSISPAQIGTIKPVRSGFAISPRNNFTREELLKAAVRLSPADAKLEAASNWISVMIPTVPISISTEKGRIEITKEMLANEIERVSSMRPASLRLYGRNLPNAPHRTWMAYFTKAPRPGTVQEPLPVEIVAQ